MKWIIRIVSLLIFSCVSVYDKQGKFVERQAIVNSHYCDLQLQDAIKEVDGLDNLQVKISKRGLKRLYNVQFRLYVGNKEIFRKQVTPITIVNAPLILTDLGSMCAE